MDISSVINESKINLKLDAHDKDEVLSAMVDMLVEAGDVNSKEEFIKDVYYRESEGETGIGDGIAIPHGKSHSVVKTSLAMARTLEPVEWETLDGKPVRFIILFAVRDIDKTTVHIKLLSEVATKLADEEVLDKLLTSDTPTEIISIFN